MENIIFVRKWSGGGKETTWSGTPIGLLTSLKERCNPKQVKEIAVEYGCIAMLITKFARGLYKVFSIDGCDVVERKIESLIVNKELKNTKDIPVIVFSECFTSNIEDTYVFLDCSVDYAFRCNESNGEYARYVPFAKRRKHTLIRLRNNMAIDFYKKCKGIFTMGEWLAEDLIYNTGIQESKVHVVGGGCNLSLGNIDISHKAKKRFLFVGKDFERKNGKLVVEAFSLLNKRSGNCYEIYIAGPNKWPLSDEIPDGVYFCGLKSSQELVEYFNLCDVFVMPSKFEAYGLVFCEALIYGLPCIGRDAYSMSDFIKHGENGYLLRENSPEELAHLMELAIKNDEMYYQVQSNRDYYISQYSWNTVVDKMICVMRKDGYNV